MKALMIGIVAAGLAAGVHAQEVSPLSRNSPTSDYRVIQVIAPESEASGWQPSEMRGMTLADVGNLRRNPDGSRTLPIVFLRPASQRDRAREVAVYYDARVDCRSLRYDSGPPRYETMAGPTPLRADMDWRPSLSGSELQAVSDIVCSPIRAGVAVGPKSREDLLSWMTPDP